MTAAEAIEVARIASAAGRPPAPSRGRPFRAPHHTISPVHLLGGGVPPRIGEATLAHNGVLYLDELAEFSREAIEALRGPLATGEVPVKMHGRVEAFPSRFQLIASTPSCPCGRGRSDEECACSPEAVRHFGERIASGFGHRIELVAPLRRPSAEEIGGAPGEPSAAVRERVVAARERQRSRLGDSRCNADLSVEETRGIVLTPRAADVLRRGVLPEVAGRRARRVGRTLADLAGSEDVGACEISEAISLCSWWSGD